MRIREEKIIDLKSIHAEYCKMLTGELLKYDICSLGKFSTQPVESIKIRALAQFVNEDAMKDAYTVSNRPDRLQEKLT